MISAIINNCPGTLAPNHSTYSRTCLRRVFNKRTVGHILPYDSPAMTGERESLYLDNIKRISISGVQEKYSMRLDKNKLRLIREGEQGQYILKPIPKVGKNKDQMPANEHLTMQIARQVFGIETAENALIFFNDGEPAYLTKRFDVKDDGSKRAKEDFASLAGRTPQTYGEHYKYSGNYLQLFELMKVHLPVYRLEAPKLLLLLGFNYLFSNGDAHFKNFSLIETPMGDFRLSPAYDLLNTRMHIEDSDFALDDGLLPRNLALGNIRQQLLVLGSHALLTKTQIDRVLQTLILGKQQVERLIQLSYLNEKSKRSYLQLYQKRHKKLAK